MSDDTDYLAMLKGDRNPRPIACMRPARRGSMYDAEVSFCGVHYVVGTGFATRDLAYAEAKLHVDAMIAMIDQFVGSYIKKFPQAKE